MARRLYLTLLAFLVACGSQPDPRPEGGTDVETPEVKETPGAVLSSSSGSSFVPVKNETKPIEQSKLPKDVYAMVNGKPVTEAAIQERLEAFPDIPPQQMEQMRVRTGEMLIAERLIDMCLTTGQMKIADKDLQTSTDRFNQMLEENKITKAEYIERSKATEAQMQRMFRLEALLWSQVDEKSMADIRDEIKDRIEESRTVELILKGGQGVTEDEKPKLRKEADKLRGRALEGEDFTGLITEFSDDPSAKRTKGRLGPITRKSLRPELAAMTEAIFGLKSEGEISEVVETPLGYMVLKLVDVEKETITIPGGQMGPPRTIPVKEYCEGMAYQKAKSEFFQALFENNVVVRHPAPPGPGGPNGPGPMPPRR